MKSIHVTGRDGLVKGIDVDEISKRLTTLCYGLNFDFVDPLVVARKVVGGSCPNITTGELDTLTAETCAYMSQVHPDYSKLAARVAVSQLHMTTNRSFKENIFFLSELKDSHGSRVELICAELVEVVATFGTELDAAIDYCRDFEYDYFGFKTLERSYLMRHPQTRDVIERPQHMLMRVALGIHGKDVESAIKTYEYMSLGRFTHSTPTLFNAGTMNPQMSSCFLLPIIDDSIEGIFEALKQCAIISNGSGGIGVSVSDVRASGSYIRGSNGFSNGLVPMLRVFNSTARYVDQGGGKRKGGIAVFVEPWHADIFDFLDLRKNHGNEEARCRDLFTGLWIPDLFMKRVKDDDQWTLFCPNDVPGLTERYGSAFEELYVKYEQDGKLRKAVTAASTLRRGKCNVRAQQLWLKIMESQQETGTPFMCYKDAVNHKNITMNVGTIKCSNLCTEIMQYADRGETAVCNLASVSLPSFVKTANREYDFASLKDCVKLMTVNLNKVINRNYYPLEQAAVNNMRHRPIGIGVQGLADTFLLMGIAFESADALRLNEHIFETIYFAALDASSDIAAIDGPYASYAGSPVSNGHLNFDLWGVSPSSGLWDWGALREKIEKTGLRNSLLTAQMPTASTAHILGNTESTEPYNQNMYVRRVSSGDFIQVNRHLVDALHAKGLWNSVMKNKLIAHKGSVQFINEIPLEIKQLFKTVWEIKQKHIIDMAVSRAPYRPKSEYDDSYV